MRKSKTKISHKTSDDENLKKILQNFDKQY